MKKFEILNTIHNNCSLSSKEILVAQYFVYKSNKEGICYPSVHTIAVECGVSERTVQRATGKLQEKGYLDVKKRVVHGKQASNRYQLSCGMPHEPAEQAYKVNRGESAEDIQDIPAMKIIELDEILYTGGNKTEDEWISVEPAEAPLHDMDLLAGEKEYQVPEAAKGLAERPEQVNIFVAARGQRRRKIIWHEAGRGGDIRGTRLLVIYLCIIIKRYFMKAREDRAAADQYLEATVIYFYVEYKNMRIFLPFLGVSP